LAKTAIHLEAMLTRTSFKPTAEQQAVVDSVHAKMVVRAAAGAGKTWVLVERYLKHVAEDGLAPDQILTITFTRKAAAEMKRRIVDRLRERRLTEQAQMAETGPIQTIHGFCERLLRENSLAAGLDPEFTILAGAQSARMLEDAVRQALASPPDDNPYVEKLIIDLAGRRTYGELTSPHSLLSRAVRDVLHGLRATGIGPSDLLDAHSNPHALIESWHRQLLGTLDPEIRDAVLADTSGDHLGTRLAAAFKATKKRKPKWLRGPTPEADITCAEHTCGLVQIAASAWRTLEKQMVVEQAMDFSALEARAVRLIEESEGVRNRVQEQYRIVLVDEAQDVNPVQHRLLDIMGISTQMFVGDAQQSIYGFRQADVKLFRQKLESLEKLELNKNWRSHESILAFVDLLFGALWGDDNYKPMIDRATSFDPDADVIQLLNQVEFWHQTTKDTTLTAEWVKQLLEEIKEEHIEEPDGTTRPMRASDVAILVRKTRFALELLPKLEARGVRARIAGGTERFYTRLEVRDMANALRCLADPHDDFALLAALRSPLAGLSLDSIALLAKRKPVITALEDFEPPISDDLPILEEFKRWYLPLKAYADRLSAWEVMSELLASTGFLENLARRHNGAQVIANIRKLLVLAAQEPDLGPLEYADRIQEIQQLHHQEGDAPASDENDDAVTIMTIHKAKGLEFPVVVVPETHESMNGRSKDVETDQWLRLVTTRFSLQPSLFHFWLEGLRHERDEEEELRVLYVALTRAKKRLCICLHPRAPHNTLASRICRSIGYKDRPPGGVSIRE
jgi:ATP-dependent helicase/nuclease subunit A